MLPCVILFLDGVAKDRVVGFDSLGSKDDFPTSVLEQRLLAAGVVQPAPKRGDDSDDEGAEQQRRTVYRGFAGQEQERRTESDEDSDFD